jgi:hypothetical protein
MSDMITFPSTIIAPSFGSTVDVEDSSIVSKMEDGSVVARRKFTKSRKKWRLQWDALPIAQYNTLINFLQNTVYFAALSFQWTSFTDGNTYTVRYSEKEDFTTKAVGFMSGSITIVEV